jgi:hypothetical protein
VHAYRKAAGRTMERENQIWFFEVIRLEVRGAPPKVLERTFAPRSEATRENARKLLESRFNDPAYSKRHGNLKPEAVRFLDEQNREVVRYTAVKLLSESQPKPNRETDDA